MLKTLDGVIREMDSNNFGAVYDMFCALYEYLGELGFLFKVDKEKLKRNLAERIDSKYFKIYVFEDRDSPAGFINLSIVKKNSNFSGDSLTGVIDELYVKEEYRGKNIGEALIDKARRFFASNNINYVRVQSVCANEGAIKFYKKLGFKEDFISLIWE